MQIDEATGQILFSTILEGDNKTEVYDMEIIGDQMHLVGILRGGPGDTSFFTTDGATTVGDGATTSTGSSDLFYRVYDINTHTILHSTIIGGFGTEKNPTIQYENGKIHIITGGTEGFPTTDGTTAYTGTATTNTHFSIFYLEVNPTSFNIDFSGLVAPGLTNHDGRNLNPLKYGESIIDGNYLHVLSYIEYYAASFFGVISDKPDLPTTTGIGSNGDSDYFYTKYDLTTKQIVATTHLGGADGEILIFGRSGIGNLSVYNDKAYVLIDRVVPPFSTPTTGDVPAGSSSIIYYRLDENANAEIARVISGSGDETAADLVVNSEGIFVAGTTTSSDLVQTNPELLKGSEDVFIAKYEHDTGNLRFSTVLSSGDEDFLAEIPKIHVDDDRIYVSGIHDSGVPGNFPVTNPSYSGLTGAAFSTVYQICADVNFDTSNDALTPATQTSCSQGLVQQIVGSKIIIDPNSLPLLYENGVPRPQNIIEAKYQWETAASASGPWTEIVGATQQNFSPQPSNTDRYFRRISEKSDCCNNEIVSTSDVAAVLVTTNGAPVVDAGGVFNTCTGTAVTIGNAGGTTGGVAPYTFTWDQGAGNTETVTVSPTETTVYTLTVTDANGCEQIDQAIVNAYTANAGDDSGLCDGTPIRIGTAAIPGLAGVVYSWDNGATLSCTDCAQPTATPATPTTYTLTMTLPITGGGTCMTTDDVLVSPVSAPMTVNPAGPDIVICKGDVGNLGTPAEAGFNYTWAPGNYLDQNDQSTATFTPGSLDFPTPNPFRYYLTTEQSGCIYVDEVVAAVIEANAGNDGCGPRQLGVKDETPDIEETYTWTKISGPGNFTSATDIARPSVSESITGATIYEVTVSYNGQTCTDQVEVPPCGCAIDIVVEAPSSCPDFDANGGAVTLIAGAADIYSVNPDDFTYTWTPNAGLSAYDQRTVTLTDNVARTYTVTMGSPYDPAFACTEVIEVNNPAWALPTFSATDESVCANVPIQIGAPTVAGYIYSWSSGHLLDNPTNSNPTATPTTTTTFTVTVTDTGSGCIATEDVLVTTQDVANAGIDQVVCGSEVVRLGNNTTFPGYTYSWAPAGASWQNGTDASSAQPEVLVAVDQMFTLTVTHDATGCSTTDDVEVTVGIPVPPFTLADIPFCPSDASLQIGSGVPSGYTYNWTPAILLDDATAQMPNLNIPLPNGTVEFNVTVSDPSGCNFTTSQTIVPNISIPDPGASQAACVDEGVELGSSSNATGAGISYSWTPTTGLSSTTTPTTTFTPTAAGTFTFTLEKNEGGCVSSKQVTVVANEADLPTFSNPTVCQGACVEIGAAAQSGVSYQWSPTTGLSNANIANPIACPTATTTYTVVATFTNGCIVTQDVLVSVNTTDAPTISITNQTACLGTNDLMFSPTVTPATGNYIYEWSPNDGTVSDIYALNPEIFAFGTGQFSYDLSVTDTDTGCRTEASASLLIENCESLFNCVNPTGSLSAVVGTCTGATVNNDAVINLSSVMNGDEANISIGSTYSGPAYGDVANTDVTSGSAAFTGLLHNTQYTVRVFNTRNDCFVDYTLSTPDINCVLPTYSLGNRVFFDDDVNGAQNGAEAGIDGVQLQLLNADGTVYDSNATTAGIQPLIVTTGNDGYYRFDEIPAGDYIVEILATDFNSGGVLENYVSTNGAQQEINPNANADTNDNGLDTPVAGATRSGIITLGDTEPTSEDEPISYAAGSTTGTAAPDTDSNLTVDFGFYRQRDYPDYDDPIVSPCTEDPCHFLSSDIHLGSGVTPDLNSNGSPSADNDVDDGLVWGSSVSIVPDGILNLPIEIYNNTGNDAYFWMWIDWNGDNDFSDANEQVANVVYASGTNNGNFKIHHQVIVPQDAIQSENIALRMRLSTDDTNSGSACGNGTCADDGEVEDYLLTVSCPPKNCAPGVMLQIRRN